MSRRWLHTSLTCIAVSVPLFSWTTSASAGSVALRATIGIEERVVPSSQPGCLLTGSIRGIGTTTKLGAVHLTSTDCINPLSTSAFVFVSDAVTLTVDGGDQLWAAYGGTLSATSGSIKGTYVIIGGTGRFEHATGIGAIEGVEQIDLQNGSGYGQVQLKGTVFYR